LGRTRARLILALGVVVIVGACGSTNPTPKPSPTLQPSATPIGPVILTSPPPQPISGLADPTTPAYQASSGFTPDAVRVITVLSLQVSLERYRSQHGAYPSKLAALFPADAPLGPNGKSMTKPPSTNDGYTYSGGGAAYTLSVVLASGQTYTVHPQAGS
jgi:hypothetical protein